MKWALIIGGVVVVGAGVWYFFLRDKPNVTIADAVFTGESSVPGRSATQVDPTGADSPGGKIPPVMTTQTKSVSASLAYPPAKTRASHA